MGPTRWVTLGFVVMAGLVAIVLSKALAAIAGSAKLPDYALLGPTVTVSTLIAWAASIGVGLYYFRDEKIHTLASEVVVELRKVVWPTMQETRQATIVVVITTIIIALILYMFDAVWSGVTSWIYT